MKTDGKAACWGHDLFGETAAPDGTFLEVSAGNVVSCGIHTNGDLECWGPKNANVTTVPPGHTFSRRVNIDTLKREDSPEQIDSWNRVWTFFDWNLRPYEDRSKPATAPAVVR